MDIDKIITESIQRVVNEQQQWSVIASTLKSYGNSFATLYNTIYKLRYGVKEGDAYLANLASFCKNVSEACYRCLQAKNLNEKTILGHFADTMNSSGVKMPNILGDTITAFDKGYTTSLRNFKNAIERGYRNKRKNSNNQVQQQNNAVPLMTLLTYSLKKLMTEYQKLYSNGFFAYQSPQNSTVINASTNAFSYADELYIKLTS